VRRISARSARLFGGVEIAAQKYRFAPLVRRVIQKEVL
jgi:hypothetical protein